MLQYSNTKACLAVKLFSISFDHVCRDIMNNKVFYQHPNLMRTLGMHETVMEVMVNVLGEGESKVGGCFTFVAVFWIQCNTGVES